MRSLVVLAVTFVIGFVVVTALVGILGSVGVEVPPLPDWFYGV
jgi:hypothetical protein